MSNKEFLNNLAKKLGKTYEEMKAEFDAFVPEVGIEYEGRLEGEELIERAETVFRNKYRDKLHSAESSPSIPITIYISGISDTQDKLWWQRNEIRKLYEQNPNKFVLEGKVNEYKVFEDGIVKRSYNRIAKVLEEINVPEVSVNAEKFDENTFIAPVDTQETGFGGKPNENVGTELPAHKYRRYVYGFAQPDAVDDMRFCKIMLRDDNTQKPTPVINKSYTTRVLDMTDKDSEEYNFLDSPTQTNFVETDWNPFAPTPFLEAVIKQDFIKDRVIPLGLVEDFLNKFEVAKANRTNKRWNDAIIVTADIVKIYVNLELDANGQKKVSDRIMADDDSLRWDFDSDKTQANINTWLSRANAIDYGENTRGIITCWPSRGKAPKDAPDGMKGPMQLNGYGVCPYEKFKTRFEMQKVRAEDL